MVAEWLSELVPIGDEGHAEYFRRHEFSAEARAADNLRGFLPKAVIRPGCARAYRAAPWPLMG